MSQPKVSLCKDLRCLPWAVHKLGIISAADLTHPRLSLTSYCVVSPQAAFYSHDCRDPPGRGRVSPWGQKRRERASSPYIYSYVHTDSKTFFGLHQQLYVFTKSAASTCVFVCQIFNRNSRKVDISPRGAGGLWSLQNPQSCKSTFKNLRY